MKDRLLWCWHSLHYYLGLSGFVVGVVLLQGVSLLDLVWPFGDRQTALVRRAIRRYLQGYFWYLCAVRSMGREFIGWDEAFAKTPGVIVANHPSMLDAPLFLSRLPRARCIYKASLRQGMLRGRAAAIAGYMNSEEGVDGLREVVHAVKGGAQFLYFPEGTRTDPTDPVELHSLYAVVARYARVPVHVFSIERDSEVLGKEGHIWRRPTLAAHFRIRHVETLSCDCAPTAALLHAAVKRVLQPLIEMNRRPFDLALYARRSVLEETPEGVEWRLELPTGEGFFAGHFPGHPIAPGALAVHWIRAAWAAGPGRRGLPAHLSRVRLLREICPGDCVHLVLRREQSTWKARLSVGENTVATAAVAGGAS